MFLAIKQAGFSSLIVTREQLEDPDINTMCLGHDCLVVYTTCKTGKGNKRLQNAGHFNTYIRCFPVDHSKTMGHTSFDNWNTYANYVRETCYIPKVRLYVQYTTLQAVAALASIDNVCILRTESQDTLTTETINELILQLFTGMTKSIDPDLYQTLEATIRLLQHILLSGVELSTTAVEHIRSLIKEDPSCRLRLTSTTTNEEEITNKDININVDVTSTSVNEKEAPSEHMHVTTPAIISTTDNLNNVQSARTEKSHTTWPNYNPRTVGLKRSLTTLGNTDSVQRLKDMRISDPPTSKGESPTNVEISGEIYNLTSQDIASTKSDILENNIVSFDGNAMTAETSNVCVESAAKLYYKLTDEQWKALNSNQRKKLRKNMQRDIQKSVTNVTTLQS